MLSQPFFVPASLMILLSIPLILCLVPRNIIYGVRTPKTLSNDRNWYQANRFGGWILLSSNVLYLFIALLFPYLSSAQDSFGIWLIHFSGFVGPLTIGLLLIRQYISRL